MQYVVDILRNIKSGSSGKGVYLKDLYAYLPKRKICFYLRDGKIEAYYSGKKIDKIVELRERNRDFTVEKAKAYLNKCKIEERGINEDDSEHVKLNITGKLFGGWTVEDHKDILELSYRNKEFTDYETNIISKACILVDDGDTDSVKYFFNKDCQSYHFNILDNRRNGSFGDTRLVRAVECLAKAIELYEASETRESMKMLGKGLHCIQDTFAHSDDFVSKCRLPFGDITFFNHIIDKFSNADDKFFIQDPISKSSNFNEDFEEGRPVNQRYSDTKTATLLYLSIFKILTTDNQRKDIDIDILERFEDASSEMCRDFFAGFFDTCKYYSEILKLHNETAQNIADEIHRNIDDSLIKSVKKSYLDSTIGVMNRNLYPNDDNTQYKTLLRYKERIIPINVFSFFKRLSIRKLENRSRIIRFAILANIILIGIATIITLFLVYNIGNIIYKRYKTIKDLLCCFSKEKPIEKEVQKQMHCVTYEAYVPQKTQVFQNKVEASLPDSSEHRPKTDVYPIFGLQFSGSEKSFLGPGDPVTLLTPNVAARLNNNKYGIEELVV